MFYWSVSRTGNVGARQKGWRSPPPHSRQFHDGTELTSFLILFV